MDKNSKILLKYLQSERKQGKEDHYYSNFITGYSALCSISESDIRACIKYLIKQGYIDEFTLDAWSNVNKCNDPTVVGFRLSHKARNGVEFKVIDIKASLKKNMIAIIALIISIIALFK